MLTPLSHGQAEGRKDTERSLWPVPKPPISGKREKKGGEKRKKRLRPLTGNVPFPQPGGRGGGVPKRWHLSFHFKTLDLTRRGEREGGIYPLPFYSADDEGERKEAKGSSSSTPSAHQPGLAGKKRKWWDRTAGPQPSFV